MALLCPAFLDIWLPFLHIMNLFRYSLWSFEAHDCSFNWYAPYEHDRTLISWKNAVHYEAYEFIWSCTTAIYLDINLLTKNSLQLGSTTKDLVSIYKCRKNVLNSSKSRRSQGESRRVEKSKSLRVLGMIWAFSNQQE